MSPMSAELQDAAWVAIDTHVHEVAALIPTHIGRTLDPKVDVDALVPRLVQALARKVPDIQVSGLPPWVSDSQKTPRVSVTSSGWTINARALSSLDARREGLASDLVRRISTSPEFPQAVQILGVAVGLREALPALSSNTKS